MTETAAIDWTTELTMQLTTDGETYPFVEDENANVTGYGHQDRAAFAAALNRYDEEATGDSLDADDRLTADDVTHRWGRPVTGGDIAEDWWLKPCPKDEPGAIAVTTVWGVR